MARKKRRKKRRIRWKAILALLGVLASLVILCYLIVILFETKKINVTGNQYASAQEVQEWVQSDPYASNTLYILWKYNKDDMKQLPMVEKITVKMKSPWEVNIQVTEKTFSGRVDFEGASLYFDRDGIASLKSADVIEGVPYIEGMELDAEKVKLGEMLPVTDEKVFETIYSVMGLLKKAEHIPDKISCNGSDLTLHFGVVRVQMGNSNYEEKLKQVMPILTKLIELYPGQAGELHMENYTKSDSSIRFVPDPPSAEEPAPEDASENGDNTWDGSGDTTWTDYGDDTWTDYGDGTWDGSGDTTWTDYGDDTWTDYGDGTWDGSGDNTWDASGESTWQ